MTQEQLLVRGLKIGDEIKRFCCGKPEDNTYKITHFSKSGKFACDSRFKARFSVNSWGSIINHSNALYSGAGKNGYSYNLVQPEIVPVLTDHDN